MQRIYRLNPAVKDNLWGGNKLREYGKKSDKDRIAESWELSFTNGGEATVDGKSMSELFPRESWGTACEKFPFFPTLTKFIDAREKLSVQVHPSDDYALTNEGQFGKTEMWYVVEADEGSGLYMGLKHECTPNEFLAAVNDGTVENLLSFKTVKAGDVFFIPSGTIHAIGEGVVIFEIQQNSTLTYRLYDYMRRDKDGNLRELHIEKAMKVLNTGVYQPEAFDNSDKAGRVIGKCEYFTAREYDVKSPLTINTTKKSFLSLTVISGAGSISAGDSTYTAAAGDSFFAPANEGVIHVDGDMKIITVEI